MFGMFNSTQSRLLRRKFAFCSFNPAKEVVWGPRSWLIQDKNRQSQNNRRKKHISLTWRYCRCILTEIAITELYISAYKISVAMQYLKNKILAKTPAIKVIPEISYTNIIQHLYKIPQHEKSRLRAAVHRGLHHSTFKTYWNKPLNTFFS